MSCENSNSNQVCACALNPNNFPASIQGKPVYKDECVKCFVDATWAGGIDLCLTTLQCFCVENNHSQEHFEKTGYPLYLNIKKVEKAQPERAEQKEITKLAIGTEGGANNPYFNKEYDEIYTVVCKKCPGTINQENFSGLIQSIKNAGGVNQMEQAAAWELDILPCECV